MDSHIGIVRSAVNSIELQLLDLLQKAETPLYSAQRWVVRQLGRELAMPEFLRLLAPLLEDDVVRLWAVDASTGERSRRSAVPPDLAERYAAEASHLDDSFDPFGLSLTLGPAAEAQANAEWGLEIDGRCFRVTAQLHAVEDVRRQVERLFPDLNFVEESRNVDGDRVEINGSITEAPGTFRVVER